MQSLNKCARRRCRRFSRVFSLHAQEKRLAQPQNKPSGSSESKMKYKVWTFSLLNPDRNEIKQNASTAARTCYSQAEVCCHVILGCCFPLARGATTKTRRCIKTYGIIYMFDVSTIVRNIVAAICPTRLFPPRRPYKWFTPRKKKKKLALFLVLIGSSNIGAHKLNWSPCRCALASVHDTHSRGGPAHRSARLPPARSSHPHRPPRSVRAPSSGRGAWLQRVFFRLDTI